MYTHNKGTRPQWWTLAIRAVSEYQHLLVKSIVSFCYTLNNVRGEHTRIDLVGVHRPWSSILVWCPVGLLPVVVAVAVSISARIVVLLSLVVILLSGVLVVSLIVVGTLWSVVGIVVAVPWGFLEVTTLSRSLVGAASPPRPAPGAAPVSPSFVT